MLWRLISMCRSDADRAECLGNALDGITNGDSAPDAGGRAGLSKTLR
jgi:hypothetical protein